MCISALLAVGQESATPTPSHWLIEPGYGTYYLINNNFNFPNSINYKYYHASNLSIGPVTFRALYQPSKYKKWYWGGEMSFGYISKFYIHQLGTPIIRVQSTGLKGFFTTQYNFYQEENLSAYLSVGIGLQLAGAEADIDFINDTTSNQHESYTALPLAARGAAGLRYKLSPHVGVWAEVGYSGIAGPMIGGGLTFVSTRKSGK